MKKLLTPSLSSFIFCCLFLFASHLYVNLQRENPYTNLISWDVAGYYLYLPGIFYDDLGELNNRQYIVDNYHPSGDGLDAHRGPIGKYVLKYSSGMAVMYLPAFAAGHVYAKLGNYPVDGFSFPYQLCLAIYSLLIAFAGLWISRLLLLKYFSETVTALCLFSLVLATNYLNYAGISNMLSHNYLFTLYTLLLYLIYRWQQKFSYTQSIGVGLLCGLAALARPTEVISILIPLFWGIAGYNELKQRIAILQQQYRKVLVIVACAVLIGSLQLIYWNLYAGKLLYWSYNDYEKLNVLRVHFSQVLFSYKKGWFVYTPFMAIAIAGFIFLYKQHKSLFWCSLLFTVIAFHLVMSWSTWAYGGSFSMRAVVQYYAILIFPLSSFIHYATKRRITAIPFYLFLLFCIWLNLVMTHQANCTGIMESDNMTKQYYWRIFGRLHINKQDPMLIETDEEMPVVLSGKLEQVDIKEFTNGKNAVALDSSTTQIALSKEIHEDKAVWYRGYCEVYFDYWESSYNKKPLLYIEATKNDSIAKRKAFRIERVIAYKKWDTAYIDLQLPEHTQGVVINLGLQHQGSTEKAYVRKLSLYKTVE